ncbi:hypothetical protein O3M35_009559 [Rhynocoris fuscipes]|uniref:Malate dehydrogenase n=1 Tax=Rhynocoris fuscipes TaxID=488301 RepID=A0AAW1D3C5_9HEMI
MSLFHHLKLTKLLAGNCKSINFSNLLLAATKTSCTGLKIALLGAMGSVGQATALMMKQSCWFEEVALYDIVSTKGLALELNHIDTNTVATAHEGSNGIKNALTATDIVMITAGAPKKSDGSKNDQDAANSKIVAMLAKECAINCPHACICLVTNPVNSLVPIICETFKKVNRCVDPCKIFGVTTLDVVRTNTFVAEVVQMAPETVDVPVIGGHSFTTMIPLLSQIKPKTQLSTEEVVKITRAVQTTSEEIAKAKENAGSSSLGMAFAATRFAISIAKGLLGHENIVECAYVMSNLIPDVSYLSTPLQLGQTGIQKNLGIPDLSNFECCLLETAIPYLKEEIKLGEDFAAQMTKQGLFAHK